ncbi:MAG TPA: DUF4031 domain-containing protein [Ktedonobacterales bacterium]|nr:DUF4031 domain-containing protein [Ktedonobacterales bacterium]
MAILVHAARATRPWLRAGVQRGDRMYHVLSDLPGSEGSAELRAYVVQYGLRPQWVQYAGTYREHYDAREPEGLAMLRDGARPATNREIGALLAAKRAAGTAAAAWEGTNGGM